MSGRAEALYFGSPVWVQNILVSLYGYILYRKRYTGIYKEIRREIERVKGMTAREVNALQEERLSQIVRICADSVPYYQKLFAEYGINGKQITSVSDLKKLPVLGKQTLREHSQDFRPRNAGNPYMIQNTSGSTGTPLALAVDEYTYKMAMALLVDHEETHGVPFGARRATFAGRMVQPLSVTRPPFSRFNQAENQRLFSSYHLKRETFPWYRRELDRFQPQELIGYPSAIADLASHYLEAVCKPGFTPKAVVTNSETLLAWQREKIESVFGCPVFDYYGTAEYVIFAGQDSDGVYRTNPLLGIAEIVPDGEDPKQGRVIATTLCNQAMPLLRYDLGDIARLHRDQAATPGALTIAEFVGRQDDYLLTMDGRKIGRIDHIFKGVTGITEAQVAQVSHSHCKIFLVTSSKSGFNEEPLIQNFHARLGSDMELEIVFTESIPRGKNGKFKSVVGLR